MKITAVTAMALRIREGDCFGGTGIVDNSAPDYTVQPGWRGLYSKHTESLIVKIKTDSGIVGFGEGQAPVAPEVAATVVDRILRPLQIGRDPTEPEVLRHEMYNAMNLRGHFGGFMLHAIAAADIALWDITGKARGVSVTSLLGGVFRSRVPVYVSGIRGATLDDKAVNARQFVQAGFRCLKTFLGFGLEQDFESVRVISEAIRPEGRLMVDVLWNYDVSAAIRLGRELERHQAMWLEAPVSPEDIGGHAEICRALDLPVAAGETEVTRHQFLPWFRARALDIAQPDVARCGITEARKIADLAGTFHIPVALHCGIMSAPGIAASLQVAAAIPNLLFLEFQPLMLTMANRFLRQPLKCDAGFLYLPEGPGLGIDLDEQSLDPYCTAIA